MGAAGPGSAAVIGGVVGSRERRCGWTRECEVEGMGGSARCWGREEGLVGIGSRRGVCVG